MKKFIAGLLSGILLSSALAVVAVSYDIYPNPFKVTVDGKEVDIEGYNIDGRSYFQLRDIGKFVGFNVGWDESNETVLIENLQPALTPNPIITPSSPPIITPSVDPIQTPSATSNNKLTPISDCKVFVDGVDITQSFKLDNNIYVPDIGESYDGTIYWKIGFASVCFFRLPIDSEVITHNNEYTETRYICTAKNTSLNKNVLSFHVKSSKYEDIVDKIVYNDSPYSFNHPVFNIDLRTYFPIEELAELFNYSCNYDKSANIFILNKIK